VVVTVLLGLAAAVCWGSPDVWLAQATRSVGPLATAFGSVLVGLLLLAPAAFFVDLPDWTVRGVGLAALVGAMSAAGYVIGFTAFRDGSVSIVAPIIACEGGLAAVFAVAGGEHLNGAVAVLVPVAAIGVVLASMGHGGGRGFIVPAVIAALLWGGILALTVPVADDLGVFWGFLLVRAFTLAAVLPFALRTRAAITWTRDRWRVAVWGIGDSGAYLLFVAAADRGPAAVASVLAAQFATVAVLVAFTFGGERLLRRQLAGIALVILAVSGIAATGA
jgi:drug/metabolite transporter (DMT)-like permease